MKGESSHTYEIPQGQLNVKILTAKVIYFFPLFLMCFRRERKDTIGFSLVFRCHFVHACASGLKSSPVPRIHCNSCEKESTP
ncbi:hypothetical protein TNIN_72251 [Trichonephila inaurata madagascariensis]|uniref:Uncharacterized protein n=1 Tax=Trichonephila inaurata madagascariensis TaxID=2747483 RepID=A0A8X6YWW7_9ARAC|nr:hypothetical protein TNIN_72251 [Trichonephila inaurata madagascariensis]